MAKLVLLSCALLLACSLRAAAGDKGPALSKEAQAAAGRALESSAVTFHSLGEKTPPADRLKKVKEAGRQFDAALDKLAGALDEAAGKRLAAAEGRDLPTKLALLARDRKGRPEVYKEVAAYFAAPDPRKPAREVDAAHAAEKYRLAWEYFLLRPDEQASAKYHAPALDALARIGNKHSIATLAHRYRVTCQEGVASRDVATEQTYLLGAVSAFRDEQGLRAMLECVALSKKQQAKEEGKSEWDAEDFVYKVLTDAYKTGSRAAWRKVLAAYPAAGLTAEQRRLLKKAADAK